MTNSNIPETTPKSSRAGKIAVLLIVGFTVVIAVGRSYLFYKANTGPHSTTAPVMDE